MILGKNYERHVVDKFYAVENNNMVSEEEDGEVGLFRRHVEESASRQQYMGEQIPIKWLKFEQSLAQLNEDRLHFSSIQQVDQAWEFFYILN